MRSFPLTISQVDGNAFDGDAVRLSLRGAEGDLAIMADHVPLVTAVQPGECRVLLPDETVRHARVNGGLLAVTPEKTIFLADGFVWAEEA